ncbi:RNA 2'-phosphotransferase [Pseudomonas cichorii]|nr:RNA 2'-phosphotransferase [Pseudomonas cichorii]
MSSEYESLSKFLSYVLRHKPEYIGLYLDGEGWATIDDLKSGAAEKEIVVDALKIKELISSSDKVRFEFSKDGLRVRAIQGHSSKLVARKFIRCSPPLYLYHGTATRFLKYICDYGIVKGKRHHVHLTTDKLAAQEAGRRYGKAVVITVNSHAMDADGYVFFKAENGVWLTDSVPPIFINKIEGA